MKDYVLFTDVARVKFAREGAAVRRVHAQKIIGEYDVGQHTFGMLCLLRVLYPDAPVALLWAIIAHDLPERLLGDTPRPAFIVLNKRAYTGASDKILKGTGFWETLPREDQRWLGSLDILEFYLWTLDQESLGNRNMKKMRRRVETWFSKEAKQSMTLRAYNFMKEIIDGASSNPDYWDPINELGE